MAVDNVWYVLKLSPTPRLFGWSRGPDTPDTGTWNDWPEGGFSTPGALFTFHWLNQNQTVAANTQEDLAANIATGTGTWKHLKTRTSETTGIWYITDNVRLTTLLREAAATFSGATRNQLNSWADFIDTSPLIPRVAV